MKRNDPSANTRNPKLGFRNIYLPFFTFSSPCRSSCRRRQRRMPGGFCACTKIIIIVPFQNTRHGRGCIYRFTPQIGANRNRPSIEVLYNEKSRKTHTTTWHEWIGSSFVGQSVKRPKTYYSFFLFFSIWSVLYDES